MTVLKVFRENVAIHVIKSAHLYRQISATFAASLLSVSGGLNFGFTAVMLPQLKNDATFPFDRDFDSWIASISPLAMIFGCVFSGSMSDGIGRKMGQIVLVVPFIIGWIVMGLATNNAMMLIGRFITGISAGATRPNTMVYIGELTDPKYRAIGLFCPSLAIPVGALISHTFGKYVYWRTCCFLFTIPNIITFITLMFLKESPLWLLSKGKIKEGIESFKLFRGDGENSKTELAAVLEKCKIKTDKSSFKENLDTILSKPFMKSLLIIFLLFVAVQWCGINSVSFYAQDMFEKTFSSNIDAFLLMIATDCIRIAAAIVVCLFANIIPRKITFISCCFTTTGMLLAVAINLYFGPSGIEWLAVTCMVAYIAIASAIVCISWSFVAEIFPATVRGFGSGISSGISFTLLFIAVKVTPEIMKHYGETVMYAVFSVFTLIAGLFLIFLLPETNGKTLQDIEDSLYKKKGEGDSNLETINVASNQRL